MNKIEIEEYNRLCAEYLGYKLVTPADRKNPEKWNSSYWEMFDEEGKSQNVLGCDKYLSFHSDWNSIEDVLNKIESSKFIVKITTSPTLTEKWISHSIQISEHTTEALFNNQYIVDCKSDYTNGESKKDTVVRGIYKFLLWNKENKLC